MKTKILFLFLLVMSISVNGQDGPKDFFSKNGTVALETKELDDKADTLAIIHHRADDIVWSKIVYRIVDLREMQNRVLSIPIKPNGDQKNLFRIIMESTIQGLPAYEKDESNRSFLPLFAKKRMEMKDVLTKFMYCDVSVDPTTKLRMCKKDDIDQIINHSGEQVKVFKYSSKSKVLVNQIRDTTIVMGNIKTVILKGDTTVTTSIDTISEQPYREYAKRQYKFLLQEIVFFNKHYSKMYTKIIGLAPLYNLTESNINGTKTKKDMNWFDFVGSVPCWFLYDELRPYLMKHYIKDGNKSQRMTFDDFFQMKLYSSYILGDDNTTDRMLLQSYQDATRIKYEQDRIEREILNVEQDVWEY